MTDTDVAQSTSRPPLGETVAVAVILGVAAFLPVLAFARLVTNPVYVAEFQYSQHQHAETLAYVLTFLAVLPGSVILAPRVVDALAARRGRAWASAAIAFAAATLLVALLAARLADAGIRGTLVAVGAFALVAAAIAWRARRQDSDLFLGGGAFERFAWPAVGILAVASLLAFTALGSISIVGLLVAIAAVGLVLWFRPAPLPRRFGRVVDWLVPVVLLLVVPDLVLFSPISTHPTLDQAFATRIYQFHQDIYLGPANVVMHGGAMLVDTASQYGVGPIYAIAAWFQLAPFGYGPLSFFDALLYVVYFSLAYAVLRFAGVSRLLSLGALALGVVVLLYNLSFPVGALLQHGPIRFGIPMLVIAAAVAEARWPRRRGIVMTVQLAAVGLSSVWALEAFAGTVVTFLALRVFATWSVGGRPSRVGADLTAALGACVVFQVGLALGTLAFWGSLPDWGNYLDFLREFLAGSVGDITYDFSAWSPGLAVGAGLFASAAALIILAWQRPELARARRPLTTAICGATAFGILLFYYFVDRSADHVLPYVSLPLLLSATLWLALAGEVHGWASPSRRWASGLAAGVAVLLVAVAWSSLGGRVAASPLGKLAPGGQSLSAAMSDLWNLRPLDPGTAAGERLLARYFPGSGPVPVVLEPEQEEELLFRSGRTTPLAFSDPYEDEFAGAAFLDKLGSRVDSLLPGSRLLLSDSSFRVLRELRADPGRDPATDPIAMQKHPLTLPQQWMLARIARRFDWRVLARDPAGFVVLVLRR